MKRLAPPRDERGSISLWMVTASFVMMMLVGLAGAAAHRSRTRAGDDA